jgi:hypothetical protein
MWSSQWNGNCQGKLKYSEKTCPSATLSTTNPTYIDLGLNPGHRNGKPATNSLSYGTGFVVSYYHPNYEESVCGVNAGNGREIFDIILTQKLLSRNPELKRPFAGHSLGRWIRELNL